MLIQSRLQQSRGCCRFICHFWTFPVMSTLRQKEMILKDKSFCAGTALKRAPSTPQDLSQISAIFLQQGVSQGTSLWELWSPKRREESHPASQKSAKSPRSSTWPAPRQHFSVWPPAKVIHHFLQIPFKTAPRNNFIIYYLV